VINRPIEIQRDERDREDMASSAKHFFPQSWGVLSSVADRSGAGIHTEWP
jgi:hypothetical protein